MDGKSLRAGAPAEGMAAQLIGLPPGEGGQFQGGEERHGEIGILLGHHGAQARKIRERFLRPLWEDQSKGLIQTAGDSREVGDQVHGKQAPFPLQLSIGFGKGV